MKPLAELEPNECRYASDSAGPADQSWAHLRLGDSGAGAVVKGRMVGGGAYRHLFCGKPVTTAPYCDDCRRKHKLTRGPGKDARSLEEMIYALDQSQYRGRTGYAEHTEPADIEVRRERAA